MAGISYLKLNDYENAITLLSNFSTDDEIIGGLALGNIGDAFADINQPEQALEYYEKASNFKSNDFTTPFYLLKAGNTAFELKQFKKAESLFTEIKEKFGKSDEAEEIDMYINKAKLAAEE
jgi:tetratricopeptide (TPR) repeat protein